MSAFVSIAIAMTAIAVLWVLIPLLRRRSQEDRIAVRQSNLSILRDQLAELESDLGSGTISAEQHARARADLERHVLEEPATSELQGRVDGKSGAWAAVTLGLLIPACAFLMYWWIGEPAGLRPPAETAQPHVTPDQADAMVARLAARLEQNPDDPDGWLMLARSYYVMQRMPEAVAAYARAVEKLTADASVYADYADAMAMSQGRRIEGKALELVGEALKIDPLQPKALAMAGTAAFYRKDYRGALVYWEKLLPLLPPESEMGKSVAGGITEARELGAIKGPVASAGTLNPVITPAPKSAPQVAAKPGAPASAGSVSGRVTLSPGLAAKADPQDTLFILARAVNGPRIPLAVLRKRVADLPMEFTLDDTLAMSPELKLSGFAEVVVSARISKSGNAISQSGDLQGASAPLKLDPKGGTRGVAIVIDGVVP